MTSDRGTDRAVLLGGSMAGLLAAVVLAERFGEVVIVDRDVFPDDPETRKGVPQSRHLHVLLARGGEILEQLFPGLIDELVAAGAVPIRWPQDVLWLGPNGWGTRTTRGLTLISCRRELLEHHVRGRVLGSGNVRTMESHDAVGLVATDVPGRREVRGARLRTRPHGDDLDLGADLVVDATGRGSDAPAWLVELGYERPKRTVINSFLGYASRYYERPPKGPGTASRDWKGLFLQPKAPEGTRAAALFPVDGDRWHVTVAGIARDYPPTDDAGFLEFAGSLRTPILYESIRDARPAGAITAYRRTENQLRHFDRLHAWPEGFVVMGDAVCCFNPIYGQGMSVAAESALVLRRWIRDGVSAQLFQKRLARTIATPWLLATGEDFRYPTTEGGRPSIGTRLIHRYLDRLTATATGDDVVARAFILVLQMMAPPTALFHPRVIGRVLRGPRRNAPEIGSPPKLPTSA